jgi:multiple sugar transport system permease protein
MKKRNSKLMKGQARKGFWLAMPFIVFSAIFFVYPVAWLLVLTFAKWNFIGFPKFVGFSNIIAVLSDSLFWTSIFNILKFMLYYMPMVLISSMLFALALRKIKYGKTFIALSFLLTNVTSSVAYTLIFQRLLDAAGPLNVFLYNNFGFTIPWYTSPDLAMFTVALMVTWKFLGYYGLIFYSGINAVPKAVYEAADIDGANSFVKFFKVTLPLINSQIIMVLVLAVTISFAIFTEVYIITGGGPMMTTTTPVLVMYEAAFNKLNPSFAAVLAIATAIICYAIIKVCRGLFEKEVNLV